MAIEELISSVRKGWGIAVLLLFILLLGAKVSMAASANNPNSNCGCTARLEGPTSTLSQGKLVHCDDIMKGFEEGQERVKIIVNLAEPAEIKARTDWHSKQSLKLLQDEIKATQVSVLSALSEGEFKLRYRFDNQAGFSGEVTQQGLEKLKNDPLVISIEPVYLLEPHLRQGIPLMRADTYRSSYNGAGVAIAICDTGIDYRHPMLGNDGFPNSKVIGGYDYGDNDADPIPDSTQAHGTCCAGIAAGDLGDVGDYIGGVAYNAKLYALKITAGSSGSATSDAMVAAWNWCVTHQNDDPDHPILVISTSFGGGRNYSTCDGSVPSMTTAANNAVAAGITVLASSGNDGYCDSIAWPSCISSVISVGAVYDAAFGTYLPCIDAASCATKYSTTGCSTGYYAIDNTAADMVTSYSNTASFLTVLSPSNQCYTTDIISTGGYSSGDYYSSFGGTSAACPYTAGAVACLQSAAKVVRGSYLSPSEVRTILTSTGDNITDNKVAIAKPRVNLGGAINSLATVPSLPWSDGFESGDFTAGGWAVAGTSPAPSVTTGAKNTGIYGAQMPGSSTGSRSITKSKSTEGYNLIHVKYDRKVTFTSATLVADWSTDGSTWNTLETTNSTTWASEDWALGTTADNNPGFRIRFRNTTGSASRYAYIDNVQITGTVLQYTISGYIRNECNVPVKGVLVDANNGGGQDTTDVNSFYEVWVDYNWSGTITPTKQDYTFEPNQMSYVNVLADQTEQNYQAANIYDLDCNGSIGFGDLRIISENWLDGPDLPGDFYKDEYNIVNFLDFAEFAEHWLEGN